MFCYRLFLYAHGNTWFAVAGGVHPPLAVLCVVPQIARLGFLSLIGEFAYSSRVHMRHKLTTNKNWCIAEFILINIAMFYTFTKKVFCAFFKHD